MSTPQNLKKTPSFMDKDMLKNSQTYAHSPQSEINFEEYIKNLDELVNSKVAQGFQMMISKIVVLIEEQVKFRVNEEVAEQLGKMIIKGKLMQQVTEKARSQDGKSVKEVLLEMDSSNNSDMQQCVSVLDMEQSYSKIDKIDEETEDEGTYNTQNGNSEREHASLMQSRLTLNQDDSKIMTGTNNSVSNIEVSIEQPMKATIKPTNMQTLRKSKDNLSFNMNQTLTSTSQSTQEKQVKTFRTSKLNADKQQAKASYKKQMIGGGGSRTSRGNKKINIEENSPRQSPNQQGLEIKKTPTIVIPPPQSDLSRPKTERKIVELSNAGQKLRNQINNKVIMGGKEVKIQDASKIKWQVSPQSSFRSSHQESHIVGTHEIERQTGPVAISKMSQRGDNYNSSSNNTPSITVRTSYNAIPVKRISTQPSSRGASNQKDFERIPTPSEKYTTRISVNKLGTQPSSRGSSKLSQRDRAVSPQLQGPGTQIIEIKKHISKAKQSPIMAFAKDRSRQSGLKTMNKTIKTSPINRTMNNPKTQRNNMR